jgi:hypothetical protein
LGHTERGRGIDEMARFIDGYDILQLLKSHELAKC